MGAESAPIFKIKNLASLNNKSENKKWGQKAPPHTINKGFKGKIPLLEQHLDGDIANAYLAVHGECARPIVKKD